MSRAELLKIFHIRAYYLFIKNNFFTERCRGTRFMLFPEAGPPPGKAERKPACTGQTDICKLPPKITYL